MTHNTTPLNISAIFQCLLYWLFQYIDLYIYISQHTTPTNKIQRFVIFSPCPPPATTNRARARSSIFESEYCVIYILPACPLFFIHTQVLCCLVSCHTRACVSRCCQSSSSLLIKLYHGGLLKEYIARSSFV